MRTIRLVLHVAHIGEKRDLYKVLIGNMGVYGKIILIWVSKN
jgi:hypothetical protein